jgi:hypothetical protein
MGDDFSWLSSLSVGRGSARFKRAEPEHEAAGGAATREWGMTGAAATAYAALRQM